MDWYDPINRLKHGTVDRSLHPCDEELGKETETVTKVTL